MVDNKECLYKNFSAETPVRAEKQVIEKYLEGKRLVEEKVLLEKEMTGYLKFYKDNFNSRNFIKDQLFDSGFT